MIIRMMVINKYQGLVMERELAIAKFQKRYGHSLQNIATEYNVVIEDVSGTVNKGWAGHVCEQYLGLPLIHPKIQILEIGN